MGRVITSAILKVRNWEETHLPIFQSALAFDLLAVVTHHTLQTAPVSLKKLFASLDYSEAGIRKHLKRVIRDEWIKLEGDGADKRVRVVVAQPKLIELFDEYAKVLNEHYGSHLK
jgi:DNA-binding MarR family transcriptional regulator